MNKQLIDDVCLEFFSSCNKLILGYSGGLDSSVLLHLLCSLPDIQPKLHAVHIHHGISPNSMHWQKHCEQICHTLKVPFQSFAVEFDRTSNVEEEARKARYAVFSSLLGPDSCLVLGHHQDDQAETVLLQLFRGAGIDGLSGMSTLSDFASSKIARPLLYSSRTQLEEYAFAYHLSWIEDESNLDMHYARNYLRQKVIPELKDRWPGLIGSVSRTASHCKAALDNLNDLAKIDGCSMSPSLSMDALKELNRVRISNVLRFWLKNCGVLAPDTKTFNRIIDEVLLAKKDATPMVQWGDYCVRRFKNTLYLVNFSLNESIQAEYTVWSDFPKPLSIDKKRTCTAKKVKQGLMIPPKAHLEMKYRMGGEEFIWHGQKKQLKKLFQEWEVAPWKRDRIPLLYIDGVLAAVVGYAISDIFYGQDSQDCWEVFLIDDVPS